MSKPSRLEILEVDPPPASFSARCNRLLDHPSAAIVLALASDAFFVSMDGTVQNLESEGVSTGQAAALRFIISAVLCGAYMLYRSPELLPTLVRPEGRLPLIRGALNALGLCLAYASFERLSLTEALTVFHLRPFLVGWLCWIYLSEVFSRIQMVAALVSFLAVVLVMQPEYLFGGIAALSAVTKPGERTLGFALVFLCTILGAVDFLLLRQIGEVDVVLILMAYMLTGTVVGPAWMLITSSPVVAMFWVQWVNISFVAVTGLFAQVTLVMALQRASGVKIAVLGYFQIIDSAIAQLIITGTLPNWLASIGMVVIMVAGIWSAIYGSEGSKDDEAVPMEEYRPVPHDEVV